MKSTDYYSAMRRRLSVAASAPRVLAPRRAQAPAVVGWVGSHDGIDASPGNRRMT